MSIPQKVRASAAVARQQRYVGALPLSGLPRLAEVLAESDGALDLDLNAGTVAGHAALTGRIAGTLSLRCRCCDQPYRVALGMPVDLRLVRDETEEQRLLHDCEPYRVQDDELPLHELVQDEVLLALPMLPRCDSCENIVNAAPVARPAQPRRDGSIDGPFAALKNLKQAVGRNRPTE